MTFDQFLEKEVWRDTISIHTISTKNDFNRALRHACFSKHPNQRLKSHAFHSGGRLEIKVPEELAGIEYEQALSKLNEVISEKWWEIKEKNHSKDSTSKKTSRRKSSVA